MATLSMTPSEGRLDEPTTLKASGLTPGAHLQLRLRNHTLKAEAVAIVVVDPGGTVDVSTQAPLEGDYRGIDAAGLFWSACSGSRAAPRPREWLAVATPATSLGSGLDEGSAGRLSRPACSCQVRTISCAPRRGSQRSPNNDSGQRAFRTPSSIVVMRTTTT